MVRRVSLILFLFLVAIQLVRPEKTNPPDRKPLDAPEPVQAILRRACFDCHSHETRWPWYSHVAPMSWMVTHHVNDGRKHMNFSAPPAKGLSYESICEVVSTGEMPMKSYTLIHTDAKLSMADGDAICTWANSKAN